MIQGKTCTECSKWKPLTEFHKHPDGKYKRRPKCKECRQKAWLRPKSHMTIEKEQLFAQGLKRCSKCGQTKSLDAFYKRVSNLDGLRFWCKQCSDGKTYQYRANNPEKIREHQQNYYYRHHDAILLRNKRVPRPGPIERKALMEKGLRHCKSCDQTKSIDEFYNQIDGYQGHRSRCKECDKRYIIQNRDRTKAYKHNYKARKTSNGGSFTVEEWQTLCEKYNNRCLCCDSDESLTVDHIIPVSKGGTSDISNIQCLCLSCNCKKRGKIIDYRPDHQGQ